MARTFHEIPEPENSDVKEVYAFFGLAMYSGGVLEKGLVNLVVALQTDGLVITRGQFDSIFDRHNQRTFGQLVKHARLRIQIPDTTEELLTGALAKRNWLVHDFFADHAAAFMTDSGRAKMIETLREVTELFQRADAEVVPLYRPILERRGITQDVISRTASEMIAGFLADSTAGETE